MDDQMNQSTDKAEAIEECEEHQPTDGCEGPQPTDGCEEPPGTVPCLEANASGKQGDASVAAPAQMYKYAAFISYQHNASDTKVAKEVQAAIESFRFPKGMGGGNKGLGKCFRDEDELAVSSLLPNSIKQALGESAALIVICSPEARQSAWVEREIKEYMALHGSDRIFAVLTDGDPQNAYPHALQGVDSDGEAAPDEGSDPLAADFRDGSRRKRRAERTRVIAALANANYDDLVQRLEKRRKKARVTIAAASLALVVLIGALGLVALSEARKHSIAESKELAARSEMELQSGHRIKAIKTALSALPSSSAELERPLVDEAREALEHALQINAMQSPWLPTYCLEMPGDVVSFVTSPNGGCWAALVDDQMNLGVFDLQTGATLHLFAMEEKFEDLKTFPADHEPREEGAENHVPSTSVDAWMLKPFDERHLLVCNREEPGGVACVEVFTGKVEWKYQSFSTDGVAVSPDGRTVGVISIDPGKYLSLTWTDTESVSIVDEANFDMADEEEALAVPDEPLPCAIDNAGNMRFAVGSYSYAYTVDDQYLHYSKGVYQMTSVECASGLQGYDGKVAVLEGEGRFFAAEDAYSKEDDSQAMEGCWLANLVDKRELLWSNDGTYDLESFVSPDDYRKYDSTGGSPAIEGTVWHEGQKVIMSAGSTVMLLSPESGEVVWSRSYSSTVLDATALLSPEGRGFLCVATAGGDLDAVLMKSSSVIIGATKGRIPFVSSEIVLGNFDMSCVLALAKPLSSSNEVMVYRLWSRSEDDVAPLFTFDEELDIARRILSANEGSGKDADLVQIPWMADQGYALSQAG